MSGRTIIIPSGTLNPNESAVIEIPENSRNGTYVARRRMLPNARPRGTQSRYNASYDVPGREVPSPWRNNQSYPPYTRPTRNALYARPPNPTYARGLNASYRRPLDSTYEGSPNATYNAPPRDATYVRLNLPSGYDPNVDTSDEYFISDPAIFPEAYDTYIVNTNEARSEASVSKNKSNWSPQKIKNRSASASHVDMMYDDPLDVSDFNPPLSSTHYEANKSYPIVVEKSSLTTTTFYDSLEPGQEDMEFSRDSLEGRRKGDFSSDSLEDSRRKRARYNIEFSQDSLDRGRRPRNMDISQDSIERGRPPRNMEISMDSIERGRPPRNMQISQDSIERGRPPRNMEISQDSIEMGRPPRNMDIGQDSLERGKRPLMRIVQGMNQSSGVEFINDSLERGRRPFARHIPPGMNQSSNTEFINDSLDRERKPFARRIPPGMNQSSRIDNSHYDSLQERAPPEQKISHTTFTKTFENADGSISQEIVETVDELSEIYDSSEDGMNDSMLGRVIGGEMGRRLEWPTPPGQPPGTGRVMHIGPNMSGTPSTPIVQTEEVKKTVTFKTSPEGVTYKVSQVNKTPSGHNLNNSTASNYYSARSNFNSRNPTPGQRNTPFYTPREFSRSPRSINTSGNNSFTGRLNATIDIVPNANASGYQDEGYENFNPVANSSLIDMNRTFNAAGGSGGRIANLERLEANEQAQFDRNLRTWQEARRRLIFDTTQLTNNQAFPGLPGMDGSNN